MAITPREEVARVLRDRLEARIVRIPEGAVDDQGTDWANVPVVTQKDLAEVFGEPLPAASDRVAELVAPGRVALTMTCPECSQAVPDSLEVDVEFKSKHGKRTLKAATKGTAVPHVCGQQALVDVTPGQAEAFPEDIADPARLLDRLMDLEEAECPIEPTLDLVASWDDDTRGDVAVYVEAILRHEEDETVVIPPMPSVLRADDAAEPTTEG